MKRGIIYLGIILLMQIQGNAQNACEFFKSDEITWYGIDFSKAKMVGSGFNNPTAIKEEYFKSWNYLFLKEAEKYNLKKFLKKPTVNFNLDIVSNRNLSIDQNKLVTYNSTETNLKDSVINDVVSEYNFDKNDGYGVLLIVDSFNKDEQMGYFDIVFIDLKSKSVLLSKKISGDARGAGFRNYWAGAIYSALKSCGTYYSSWEEEACKK